MPKKPTRNNPQYRETRTVQTAASVLRRISQKAGGGGPVLRAAGITVSPVERLRARLPETLRPHLIEVLEKPGELVLFVDAAVWAARLKLVGAELAEVAGGRRVVVKLMPAGGFRR